MTFHPALTAAALVCLLTTAAPAIQNDRPVFEKLRFGQSIAQVQKAYPKVRKLDREQFGATVVYSPFIQRYYQPDVKLAGLSEPVALELRFWKEKLWIVVAYFRKDAAPSVVTMLTKRYGPPTYREPDPSWIGQRVTVITTPGEGWFSVADHDLSAEVQDLLAAELHGSRPSRPRSK